MIHISFLCYYSSVWVQQEEGVVYMSPGVCCVIADVVLNILEKVMGTASDSSTSSSSDITSTHTLSLTTGSTTSTTGTNRCVLQQHIITGGVE